MIKQRPSSVMLAGLLMLGTAGIGSQVRADTVPTAATKPVASNTMMDKRLKVSDEAFKAERDIGSARIAIFQGETDRAKTLVSDAVTQLATVAKQAPADYPPPAPAAAQSGSATPPSTAAMAAVPSGMVPFDGQMVVADNMVLTPDKAAKVKDANDHLKNGDVRGAMDTLKQGQIDIAFTRLLMPIDGTEAHVKAAESLLDQGKYYEANLALKAAQDLVRTDTVAFADPAADAAKMTGVPAASAAATPAPATPTPAKK